MIPSKQNTLVLLLVELVVLPHRDTRNGDDQNTGCSHTAPPLHLAHSVVGSLALRRAKSIRQCRLGSTQLHFADDGFTTGREHCSSRLRVDFVVDGSDDSAADCLSHAGEQAEEGEDHGYSLAVGRRHCRHLVSDHKSASAEGDEDLAHDQVADVVSSRLAAEVDRQASAQECKHQTEAEALVFDAAGVADPNAEDHSPEAGANVVNLQHVASLRDGQAVDDLHELVEILVPAVEAELNGDGDHAGSNDSALLEEFPPDEVSASKELLPDSKDREQQQTDNDHGDEGGAAVCHASVSLQAEGQQEEHECGHEEEGSYQIEFVEIVQQGLHCCASAGPGLEHAHVLRFLLIVLEQDTERCEHHELNNGECSDCPSP